MSEVGLVRLLDDDADVVEAVSRGQVDLVVVDGSATELGVDLCRTLRNRSITPIMIVVGLSSSSDALPWLEAGADDVAPPQRPRELASRVRAVLRRMPSQPDAPEGNITVGDVTLDLDRHEVIVGPRRARLTPTQIALLHLLMSSPGQVVPRELIARRVWGESFQGSYNVLEVQIRKLRAIVEDDPRNPVRIETIRTIGYSYRG